MKISVENVSSRVKAIIARETEVTRAQLKRNGIAIYVQDMAFNYPTLAEAYKVAALNGLNKL
jgi:hypothetical protein